MSAKNINLVNTINNVQNSVQNHIKFLCNCTNNNICNKYTNDLMGYNGQLAVCVDVINSENKEKNSLFFKLLIKTIQINSHSQIEKYTDLKIFLKIDLSMLKNQLADELKLSKDYIIKMETIFEQSEKILYTSLILDNIASNFNNEKLSTLSSEIYIIASGLSSSIIKDKENNFLTENQNVTKKLINNDGKEKCFYYDGYMKFGKYVQTGDKKEIYIDTSKSVEEIMKSMGINYTHEMVSTGRNAIIGGIANTPFRKALNENNEFCIAMHM